MPGSFELPLIAKAMAASGKYDAVLALGAVVCPLLVAHVLCTSSACCWLHRGGRSCAGEGLDEPLRCSGQCGDQRRAERWPQHGRPCHLRRPDDREHGAGTL